LSRMRLDPVKPPVHHLLAKAITDVRGDGIMYKFLFQGCGLHSETGRRKARHSLLVIDRSTARSNFKLCLDDDAWRFLNRDFSVPA
jgi:hypothetical protein